MSGPGTVSSHRGPSCTALATASSAISAAFHVVRYCPSSWPKMWQMGLRPMGGPLWEKAAGKQHM